MPQKQPTVAGRGLGAELRTLRELAGLSTRRAAERLEWPQSKISKLETGKQRITPTDVAALLAIYGVAGGDRDRLLEKAERVDEPGMVEPLGGLSRESRTLIQLENEAQAIFNLEPLLVPGLLQTPDYTRAVMTACGVPNKDLEVRVVTRIGRQALLSRDRPPKLEFVIDEGALRRPMLSNRLMARQMRHIVESAERPHLTVQVLPLSLGGHSGLDESFTVLDFAREGSVVYLDHKVSGLFLEKEHELKVYRAEVTKLKATALKPDESVEFIADMARRFEQE